MKILNPGSHQFSRLVPCNTLCHHVFSVQDRQFVLDSNSLFLAELDAGEDVKRALTLPEFAASIQPEFPWYPLTKPRYLVLEACHACNFWCSYCFTQAYYPDSDKMSFAVAKRAIEYFFKDSKGWKVGFFGGEPLLNWDLVEKVVAYCSGRQFPDRPAFHVTTNATLIDEYKARFFLHNNFSLIVSLDGPAHVHNTCRKSISGKDTFDDVIRALELLRDVGISNRVTLRGTYTPETSKYLLESIEFLNKLREEGMAGHVSLEPAFLSETLCIDPVKCRESIKNANLDDLYHEYMKVAHWFVEQVRGGHSTPIFHNITKFMERILYKIHSGTECGAGVGYVSVNAVGEVFSCHREASTSIGDLNKQGFDESKRYKWLDNRIYCRTGCENCPIRYICGGGCREESLSENGRIDVPFTTSCKLKDIFFKCAVWIISELGYEKSKEITPVTKSPTNKQQSKPISYSGKQVLPLFS